MKFSALTCLTVLVTSASVADAAWSSYFKGQAGDVGEVKVRSYLLIYWLLSD